MISQLDFSSLVGQRLIQVKRPHQLFPKSLAKSPLPGPRHFPQAALQRFGSATLRIALRQETPDLSDLGPPSNPNGGPRPVLPTKVEATDKSGSSTTAFALQTSVYTVLRRDKTPVMSFEVFDPKGTNY